MDMKLIGKKITKYRKKRDWTQRQLAKQLSVRITRNRMIMLDSLLQSQN